VKAGFEYCKRDGASYLFINDGTIRDSMEFSEIWNINFPIEKRSPRRRAQKWGFMNRYYFKGRNPKILKGQRFNSTIQVRQAADVITSRESPSFPWTAEIIGNLSFHGVLLSSQESTDQLSYPVNVSAWISRENSEILMMG
jgi:hypothetical protein